MANLPPEWRKTVDKTLKEVDGLGDVLVYRGSDNQKVSVMAVEKEGKKNLYNIQDNGTTQEQVRNRDDAREKALELINSGETTKPPVYDVRYSVVVGDVAHGGRVPIKHYEVHANSKDEAKELFKENYTGDYRKIERVEYIGYQ